ncbi:MAG: hypothetical protein IJX90_04450 [Blautia sp.]|nr:hypothetical protein [Blautia sp.]
MAGKHYYQRQNKNTGKSSGTKKPSEGRPSEPSGPDPKGRKKNGRLPDKRPDAAKDSLFARLKRHLGSEREKIRDLPVLEKAAYIRDYYWLWIIGILAAVIIPCYMIYRAFFTTKDYWFYAVYANTTADAGNRSDLWWDFVDYAGFNTREKKVEFNAASFFDPSKSGGTTNSYYQAFVALVESGDLDILTMEEPEGFKGIGSSGRLLDLNDEKCDAIREKYADRLVYCDPYDEEYSDSPVPVGIDISDSLLVSKYHVYEEGCYLGISAYSERIGAVEEFLEFVLSRET